MIRVTIRAVERFVRLAFFYQFARGVAHGLLGIGVTALEKRERFCKFRITVNKKSNHGLQFVCCACRLLLCLSELCVLVIDRKDV